MTKRDVVVKTRVSNKLFRSLKFCYQFITKHFKMDTLTKNNCIRNRSPYFNEIENLRIIQYIRLTLDLMKFYCNFLHLIQVFGEQ